MGFYKLTILSCAFSHLMKVLKEPSKIMEINAQRMYSIEDKTAKLAAGIPYMSKRITTMKKIRMQKDSLMQTFPLDKIVSFLSKEEVGDMAVGGFSILVDDGSLKEMCERILGKKIADKRFVLKFVNNTAAAKEYSTKQKITDIMRIQIDKFDLKIASLDLVGIFAYQDYAKDKLLNVLNELQKDKDSLKEIADGYFKEFIIIQGVQKRIRAIKYYEMGNKNMPILKDMTVF